MTDDRTDKLTMADIQAMFDQSPAIAVLGLNVKSLDYKRAELTVAMPLNRSLERHPNTKQFHGGPIASFIDTVGDFAIGMMIGGGVPTINLRVDYLKPAVGDMLTATGRVRRAGRTIAVVDIDVFDDKGSLVAVGRGTYAPTPGR